MHRSPSTPGIFAFLNELLTAHYMLFLGLASDEFCNWLSMKWWGLHGTDILVSMAFWACGCPDWLYIWVSMGCFSFLLFERAQLRSVCRFKCWLFKCYRLQSPVIIPLPPHWIVSNYFVCSHCIQPCAYFQEEKKKQQTKSFIPLHWTSKALNAISSKQRIKKNEKVPPNCIALNHQLSFLSKN